MKKIDTATTSQLEFELEKLKKCLMTPILSAAHAGTAENKYVLERIEEIHKKLEHDNKSVPG